LLCGRRTTYDTLALILEKISQDSANITVTRLFYKMETSYGILKQGLNNALRFKLAELRDKRYHITPKGLAFLETWEKLQTFLKEE